MRMQRLTPLLALLPLSCSFEFRPPSGLVGSYELEQDCLLQVEETEAAAACSASGTRVRVTIGDDEVTFDEVAFTDTETNTECWTERSCTRTYSGTITRKERAEGTPYDGRFSRLGGSWEGTLNLKVSCAKEVAKNNAPHWCKTSADTVTYTIQAAVDEHTATITWAATNGAGGVFEALETKGGVRVADTFYKRVEQGEE
jgi:hypothetical protein